MRKSALASVLIVFAACGIVGAADAPKSDRAEIIFDHPEKFTDIKDGELPSDKGQEAILGQIRTFLVAQAKYVVPEGYKLTMTFTNIDLAGDYEPWRGADWADIRIVKSIYPPAFKFTWAVVDATGKTVREGREDIVDLAFDMRLTANMSDPVRYEKAILSDWMSSKLGDLKKLAKSR